MRHSAIMGVIAVACVVAVVDSAMLGPAGRLHHGLGKPGANHQRVLGMSFIDDNWADPPPVLLLAQLGLASGALARLPKLASDTTADEPFAPPAPPTAFGAPAFGREAIAPPRAAAAPPAPPSPPAPPATPPEPPPKASPLTPISLLSPSKPEPPPPVVPDPPVTPPVTPTPPVVPEPPVIVPVVFPPPPVSPPPPTLSTPVPIVKAPLPVPEPETWALMLLGCGAVASALRRRRRRAGFWAATGAPGGA